MYTRGWQAGSGDPHVRPEEKEKGGWLKSPDLGNDHWIDQACQGQGPVGLCCGCCPRGETVAYEADRQVLTAFN